MTERIEMLSSEIRTNWRGALDHITRGGEVVVIHYNRPVALISPFPQEDTMTTSQRFSSDRDAKAEIVAALSPDADAYDIDAIFAEAYTYRVDHDGEGNELLNTAGFESVPTKEFWEIVSRHDKTAE